MDPAQYRRACRRGCLHGSFRPATWPTGTVRAADKQTSHFTFKVSGGRRSTFLIGKGSYLRISILRSRFHREASMIRQGTMNDFDGGDTGFSYHDGVAVHVLRATCDQDTGRSTIGAGRRVDGNSITRDNSKSTVIRCLRSW